MEHDDAPTSPIRRSWERCAELGLSPGQPLPDARVSQAILAERLAANERLVAYAQPVIENLHQQIARSSSTVLLADSSGMILRSVGDLDFLTKATRVALTPGSVWSETHMGTNAIGTALLEQRPVAVFGDQHYLTRNHFLTCISTPIHGPEGGLLGVLDISSDARVTHTHAQALLRTTAEVIENRLIETLPGGVLALRFHAAPEALGTPLEGLVVLDGAGQVLACNRRASQLLGGENQPGALQRYFRGSLPMLMDHVRRRGGQTLLLRGANGREYAATLALLAAVPGAPPAPSPLAGRSAGGGIEAAAPSSPGQLGAPTLADLSLGDPRMAEAVRLASCIVERDIPLMIQGETGSGKEVFAQAFHRSSRRRDGPFVAVNCAAIPATLIEAELFGYVEGAYTGARRQGSKGKIREAHGGTLFLDEIGDMPQALQAVLLRVLETRRVAPVGGGAEEMVDIALVCASHRPLKALVKQGEFRADLFFRLSGITVGLPPLRERSDFSALVRQLLRDESPQRPLRISPEALAALHRHPWPGNLRQLRNVLRLAVAMVGDETLLDLRHLPEDLLEESRAQAPGGGATGQSLRTSEARLVRDTLARHRGNISAAARELGITRTTLYRKLRQDEPAADGAPPFPFAPLSPPAGQ